MLGLFKKKAEEKPLTIEQRVAELGLTTLVSEEMEGKKIDTSDALANLLIKGKIKAEQYKICVLAKDGAGLTFENIAFKGYFPKKTEEADYSLA